MSLGHNDAELRANIVLMLIRLNNLMIKHGNSERLAGKYDLSQQQWTLLAVLYRNGQGMTMTDLGKNLLVTKANMTGMIDRLERDGYVTRHPDQFDRRVTKVMLTDKGTTFIEEITGPRDEFTEEMLQHFSQDERKQLMEHLDRLFEQLNR